MARLNIASRTPGNVSRLELSPNSAAPIFQEDPGQKNQLKTKYQHQDQSGGRRSEFPVSGRSSPSVRQLNERNHNNSPKGYSKERRSKVGVNLRKRRLGRVSPSSRPQPNHYEKRTGHIPCPPSQEV